MMELRDLWRFIAATLTLMICDLVLTEIWRPHQSYSVTNAVFAVGYVIMRAIREPRP